MPDAANSNVPPRTFDMREDPKGWTVYDSRTGEPALLKGVPQTGLDVLRADGLVDALNQSVLQTGRNVST